MTGGQSPVRMNDRHSFPVGGLAHHNEQKLLPLSLDEFLCRFLLQSS
jgi:hypothetical protein